jgi:hypothetical protein
LETGPGAEEKLVSHIRNWITEKGVGSEFDLHVPDPSNSNNTISRKHSPNTGTFTYWVYGQNCGWWSAEMTTDVGIWPTSEQRKEIKSFNSGVGPFDRYSDNEVLRRRFAAEGGRMVESFRKLFGERPPIEVRPSEAYPLMIEPGPYGLLERARGNVLEDRP